MGFLSKLFGRKADPPKAPEAVTQKPDERAEHPPPAAVDDAERVRVFDTYGREFFFTKEQWRTRILPDNLKTFWDDPNRLYSVIVDGLEQGFVEEVVDAARHLSTIDPIARRGSCLYGMVLLKRGRLDEAESVLTEAISRVGEDPYLLTNLAKVYDARKDVDQTARTLWHAIELDPNQEHALLWFVAREYECRGAAARIAALQKVATLPGSWRAQLELADTALEEQRTDEAMALYRESLARAGEPVPSDLLFYMSGALGARNHLRELLQLTRPPFSAALHGIGTGNNLVKAHIELGEFDAAQSLLDELHAQRRSEWAKVLNFWDDELARKRQAARGAANAPITRLNMQLLEGPVWLGETSKALFYAKSSEAPVVVFLGSSAEAPASTSDLEGLHLSAVPGRVSRAIPLFFAEQVHFYSEARVQAIFPSVEERGGQFLIGGSPWSPEAVRHFIQSLIPPSRFVAVSHVKATTEPWSIELRLLRSSDGGEVSAWSVPFSLDNPAKPLTELSFRLVQTLREQGDLRNEAPPTLYMVPPTESFSNYLLRLEQLLAVSCAAPLSGEREIVTGTLGLCLDCPGNVTARLLFAQLLATIHRVQPKIIPEFADKVRRLQQEFPLPKEVLEIERQLLAEVLPADVVARPE